MATYRGANLPTGMTAPATLADPFGGTVWDTSDLVIGSSRYNAATAHAIATTGSTGLSDLQDYLNATVATTDADFKILIPVATLNGALLTLPAKINPNRHCWIVNTTIDAGSFGTARGTKVAASTTGCSIIQGPTGADNAVVQFADAATARGYSFHGCVIQTDPSAPTTDTIVVGLIACARTTAQTTIDGYPGRLYVDRCWLRGGTNQDIRRGISMNGPYLHVEDSRITEIHKIGDESAGIGGWTGAQFHKHINLTIEAGAQAILYGGADPDQPQTNLLDPADIYTERLYALKPLTWLTTHPSYAGIHWLVKTVLEGKNVRRWTIDRSWSQNCWPDAQSGHPMLFQNISNNNTNDQANRTDDIIVRHHRFDYCAHGAVLDARLTEGGTIPAHPMTGAVLDNVLMTRNGGNHDASDLIIQNGLVDSYGIALQLFNDIQNLVIDRITSDGSMWCELESDVGDPGVAASWAITNQVARLGNFGAFRSGGAVGNAALAAQCTSGLTIAGNVGFDLNPADVDPSAFVPGWDAGETHDSMGFADYTNYDYRLTTLHKTAGVGGGVPGCDIDTLNALLANVPDGGAPIPPPLPLTFAPYVL